MTSSTSAPLTSVIVPVFNGAAYLRQALDSILAQTWPNLEVIVMDDASTDASPEIIGTYRGAVQVVRQPTNKGIYANANEGIQLARGEFIAVFHADDVYLPTIVEREAEFLIRQPAVGAVFASDIFVDADDREYARLSLPAELRGNRLLSYPEVVNALLTWQNTFFRCPGAMVRAEAYRKVGTYRQDQYANTADLDMWLRIARQYPVAILEEHLFRYRHFHGNSSQRYHHLRTAPGRVFTILDDYLTAGDRALASPAALAAFEAHRAQDALLRTASHYIRSELEAAREVLRTVQLTVITGSPQVSRVRLAVLWLALQVACRLPRVEALANAFYRRWHVKAPPQAA